MLRSRVVTLAAALLLLIALVAVFYKFVRRTSRPVQLTANSSLNPVSSGVVSPDAHMLAYADKEGVHLKNLANGNVANVITLSGGEVINWTVSGWFPDSKGFLLNGLAPDAKSSLWIASVDGQVKMLVQDAFGWSVSPDGAAVAYTRHDTDADRDEIWLINPDGQKRHQPFETNSHSRLSRLQWSPDGRWLSYLQWPTDPLDFSATLQIRSPNGSAATTLVSNARLSDFFWMPGDKLVYSIQGGSGCSFEAIHVDTESGRPDGKPERIPKWHDCVEGGTVLANGERVSYIDGPMYSTVLTLSLDANGMPMGAAKRLTTSDAADSPSAWLSDNRTVVFQSTRSGQPEIFRQSDPSEPAVQLSAGTGDKYWGRATSTGKWVLYQVLPHVFPKGTNVVTYAAPRPLLRVAATGGPPELVMQEPLVLSHRCARLLDRCFISELNSAKDRLVFSIIDLEHGKGRELATFPVDSFAHYSWDVSGDGTRIAIARAGDPHIRILSLANGSVQDIPVDGWIRHQGLDWASDSQGLFIGTATADGTALLHVDLKGNVRTVWRQAGGLRTSGIQSPDGRHLAVLGWIRHGNVWEIENH